MFENFTDSEWENLKNDFYSDITYKAISEKYDIPYGQTRNIYKKFPPYLHKEKKCPYCSEYLQSNYVSRNDYSYTDCKYESRIYCPKCGHLDLSEENSTRYKPVLCNCSNCTTIRLSEAKSICETLNNGAKTNSLSFRDHVLLGAILLSQDDKTFRKIKPQKHLFKKFAPDYPYKSLNYTEICYDIFRKSERINISTEDTTTDAFSFDADNTFSGDITLSKVSYDLSISSDEYTAICYNSCFSPDKIDDAVNLWREIATEECLEYLCVLMSQLIRIPPFEVTEKMRTTISSMLHDCSASQVFYFLYRAVDYISRQIMEGRMRKEYVHRSVVTVAANRAKSYVSNGWEMPSYNRTKKNPQSILSSYYFDTILNIGENGFYSKPSPDLIKEVWNI